MDQLSLPAGGGVIGMRVDRSDATTYTRYFHKDHLGSIATITDAAGAVVERLSYDAWGKRRSPNGQDDPIRFDRQSDDARLHRHTQLADVGLVHMNGRVYDPMLGRFGTPDPMTENPFSTQGWNRYSYVGNSPLNFTDPSGYCFMGCFWQKPFKALGALLRKFPIIGQILTITAGYICGPVCSSITSAVVTGLASGDLGLALKAGFISAATAAAFTAVGDITGAFSGTLDKELLGHGPLEFMSEAHVFNIAGHAAVGCGSAVASGGKCGPGALSGAIGSFAGPIFQGLKSGAKLIATATVGGLASIAGGGKFGNGALTAAFGYLYNEAMRCAQIAAAACYLGLEVGAATGGSVGCVTTGPACPVGGPGGAAVGGLSGCAIMGGGAFITCMSNPDRPSDRAIKRQCLQECNWVLEQPDYRGDNVWEFAKCVNNCIALKNKHWDERGDN